MYVMQGGPSEFNRRSISSIIACATAFSLGPGATVVACMGLFLMAISPEFDWNRTTASAIPMIISIAASLTAPIFGRWIDRFGPRKTLLLGMFGFGLGFVCLALMPKVGWMFFAGYGFVGLMMGSQVPNGYAKIICQWFVRNRGMVIALVPAVGGGLGYAIMPQVINYMIVHHGWRAGYATTGFAILLFSLPINFMFLREGNPLPQGEIVSAQGEGEGFSQSEALRAGEFWKVFASLFLAATVFYGVIMHLFPMLLDRGIDRGAATTTLSMLAVGVVTGQLAAGVVLDHVPTPKIGAVFFLVGVAGVLLIHHGTLTATLVSGAVMTGFGQGAETSVVGYIVSRLFGLRAFSSLFGIICAGGVLAGGIGPLAYGFIFDRAQSYTPALYMGELGLVLAVVLMMTLSPYRFGGRTNERSGVGQVVQT
jgi:MFS family permease